jgi:hypothetical protein
MRIKKERKMNARKGPVKRTSTRKPAAQKAAAQKTGAQRAGAKTAAARKPAARKPAAKATARKPAARKPAARAPVKRTSAKAASARANARQSNASFAGAGARRPEDNALPSVALLDQVKIEFNQIKFMIINYAQHLRPLDRRRLNSVGMRKLSFVEKAYELATENEEFLPHWLTIEKYAVDINRFNILESVMALAKQVEEMLWNITIESSDILFTNSLEFYSSVQDAAKRRVDAAESPFNELKPFFKNRGHGSAEGEEPTDRQIERDFMATLHGRREGEVAVSNVKPKVRAGKREVVDKKFADSEQFKASEEGEISE